MKKFKTMAYIVIIAIIIIFAISIYVNASKNNEDDQKSKTLSELEYIETKFVELFNKMNNIEVRNYKITVGELSKETTESSSKSEEGNVKEEVIASKEGNDLVIGFNSKYLIEALKVIDDESITMYFNTNVSPCLVTPVSGERYEYLILPVRISQ